MDEEELRKYTGFETLLLVISLLATFMGFIFLAVGEDSSIFIVGLSATIFGAVSKSIAASKGLPNGFQWGWWLGIIGFIVVWATPSKNQSNNETKSNKYDDIEKLQKLKESGAITQEEFEREKEKILK